MNKQVTPPSEFPQVEPRPTSRSERKAYYASLPKPRARGWSHAMMAPLALANGILLIIFAPGAAAKTACAIFLASGFLLFGHSSIYHLGNWGERVHGVLRRIDHANIFLLIAGTYTPLSVMLLPTSTATLVLGIVWSGAIVGTLVHIFRMNAPRWFLVALYVALGWVAMWFLPNFLDTGGAAIVILLLAGGGAYTIGAMFYALRWPNPWPRWFGFHEFFHVGTVMGYACHSVAVWLAIFV
ncbi:PAQR family membrane homeostasis protein TrhA [Trueperella pyogenes]|uniref:PAQR family membrane homeostasis protein TrhA n=1 Tax=Trueperella pyogenes TaxID=1661 RepID=UPI00324DDB6B